MKSTRNGSCSQFLLTPCLLSFLFHFSHRSLLKPCLFIRTTSMFLTLFLKLISQPLQILQLVKYFALSLKSEFDLIVKHFRNWFCVSISINLCIYFIKVPWRTGALLLIGMLLKYCLSSLLHPFPLIFSWFIR